MSHAPYDDRSLLKHPVEAALAVLLLVSLLFIVPESEPTRTATAEPCNLATAVGCSVQPQ